MSRTLIFQPKTEQDKKHKDTSNTIFTDLSDYRPSVWQSLTLKGTVILAFCDSYLSVNTDIDIPIMQPNGNN